MFTWNFQFISRSRLIDTFNQLKLDPANGDILIRIHTAAHYADEAVELAKFIKRFVPSAKIFGTSTSAIIINGKLVKNQCAISITQMNGGKVKTALLPTFVEDGSKTIPADELCKNVKDAVIDEETKVLLAFLTVRYLDGDGFVEKSNDYFPGVHMVGGLADAQGSTLEKLPDNTFVFDDNGWTEKGIILASLSGDGLECISSAATGVEAIGEDMEITDVFGSCILSMDHKDAAEIYKNGIGEEIKNRPELSSLFPYVYSDDPDYPIFVNYKEDINGRALIKANHNVRVGRKLRRAFIYDKKIVSDNRAMFQRIESFDKNETIFAYSCIVRSIIYSNCVQWELSAYENSNMCGCITYGEIVNIDGKNKFLNGSFVTTVVGEDHANQEFNPYAFIYSDSFSYDNEELLNYLTDVEMRFEQNEESASAMALKTFVRDCETKLFYSDKLGIPNQAALKLDIKIKGVDRLCIIDVSDTISMSTVYSNQLIQLTFRNYLQSSASFAGFKNYNIYTLDNWRIAIGAKSYMVSLEEFGTDMEELQKELFDNKDEYIPIVPIFTVIDNCTVDNFMSAYNAARVRMSQKNIQFDIINTKDNQLDENAILEKYRMVNVINYAIANDKIIPHYQGIYDNETGEINHYEALMRIEDENGKLYYPDSFLDVAREYGLLYDRLSLQMIRKVFYKFKNSEKSSVSINLGIRDIRNREIIDFIYDFLSTVKNPGNYILELLENEDIDDYNVMIEFVDKIHELGGKVAIDDFGSGFSNLQHVINLRTDCVKIDGSIVRKCCENIGAENLLALISTWKSLSERKINIIAEYVENQEIQNKVLAYNIDYSQGYLFAEPTGDIKID